MSDTYALLVIAFAVAIIIYKRRQGMSTTSTVEAYVEDNVDIALLSALYKRIHSPKSIDIYCFKNGIAQGSPVHTMAQALCSKAQGRVLLGYSHEIQLVGDDDTIFVPISALFPEYDESLIYAEPHTIVRPRHARTAQKVQHREPSFFDLYQEA